MNKDKYVFAQLVEFMDNFKFLHIVKKYGGDKYEKVILVGISLTDKTHLRDLFDKSNFKNVNVLSGSNEPNLFSFQSEHF